MALPDEKENPCGGRGRGKRENAGVLLTQLIVLYNTFIPDLVKAGHKDFPLIDIVKAYRVLGLGPN
jgi:hypothetical protein